MSDGRGPRDRHAARDEQGIATIIVMVMGLVLSLLAAAVLEYSQRSETASRHDQSWNGALAAAEGGIDDYLFRLNQNANYWQYNAGNPPPDGNTAFSALNTVAGASSQSQFRYDVDTSTIATDGRIRLTSTGQVRAVKRTVFATLRRRSFLDYLYFTDYETKDPAAYTGSPFTAAQAQSRCAFWWYGSSGSRRDVDARIDYAGDSDSSSAYCTEINFITADTIKGPLHTNDAFLVCGNPKFNGDTSSSWTGASGLRYRVNSSCGASAPVFANPGDPKLLSPLTMPPSNSALRAETVAGTGGCLYTGPTRIKLNSAGTMTVKSPFSKVTNNSPCPTNGTGVLPTNGVIFVQNVPATTTDPNYTNGCPYNVNSRAHPLGMPITNDTNTYGCRNGDVFIEGTLKGQLTIATENDVEITWHLGYLNGTTGSDLLGLIANNYVEIYHPVNSGGSNLNASFFGETARTTPFTDATVAAAILSVNHSFWVQQYAVASPNGTLSVTGAIAQRYRGPVGTNSGGVVASGYAKNYVYDQRLKYLSPPKFLDPVSAQWGVATWAENKVPAGY